MDTGEALDREVIVERAEELRGWLTGIGLSSRSLGALERELAGIIADDPGSYINGQRPLVGLTFADFVAALHSRNAGAVGQVKGVGDAVLKELRAAIAPDVAFAPSPQPEPEALPSPEAAAESEAAPVVEALAPELASVPEAVAPEPRPAPVVEAVAEPEAAAAPRRRGRPKGSTAARNGVAPPGPAVEPAAAQPPARRRGRPRRDATQTAAGGAAVRPGPALLAVALPAQAQPAAPVPAPAVGDAALDQLVRLWPELHPHARRAVVLYASTLLAELAYEG